jgi:hypothetical protein
VTLFGVNDSLVNTVRESFEEGRLRFANNLRRATQFNSPKHAWACFEAVSDTLESMAGESADTLVPICLVPGRARGGVLREGPGG